MSTALRYPTFVSSMNGQSLQLTKQVVFAVGGSLALWASAKLQVPFYPVPLTMQTFVVLMIGMIAGSRLGAATVALYLLEGACGLPVFAGTPVKGIGLAYMIGPTGGYLVGHLLAAATCGWLAERGWGRNIGTTAAAMLCGNALIYLPGLLWLGTVLGWDKPISGLGSNTLCIWGSGENRSCRGPVANRMASARRTSRSAKLNTGRKFVAVGNENDEQRYIGPQVQHHRPRCRHDDADLCRSRGKLGDLGC